MQFRSILPSSSQQKQHLKQQISKYRNKLKQAIQQQQKLLYDNKNMVNSSSSNNNSMNTNNLMNTNKQIQILRQKINTLNLRLQLIDKCSQFSLLRLNHLQQIFKYYCTHIFKIGKHMTFDRLQYQKQHLNVQRFFLFLKDFNLTTIQIQNKTKQLLSKQNIITIFKKVSSNCRDFTFQQFIKCLQKIAVLYYDEKSNFYQKIDNQKLQRIKRKKQIEKRKIKRMKLNGQKIDPKIQSEINKLNQQQNLINNHNKNNYDKQKNKNQQNEDKENLEQQQQSPRHKLNQNYQNKQNCDKQEKNNQFDNQNDQLLLQMMVNNQIQDPHEQINKFTQQKRNQLIEHDKNIKNQQQYQSKLLSLTNDQKIQYFYQLIGVDSVKQYKNKLTVLNMPLFKNKNKQSTQKQKSNNNNKGSSKNIQNKNHKTIDDSVMQRSNSLEDQQRLKKLKQKMNQKKQKLKNQPIPKPKQVKQSETAKKRRQMKQQRQLRMQQNLQQKKQQNKQILKKPQGSSKNQQNSVTTARINYNQKQVNWQMLQKLSLDQLKLRNFQPTKLYHQQQDDHIYLNQYGGGYKVPYSNRQIVMQNRQRQSLSIVQNVRKRADQLEKNQKNQQNKLLNKLSQKRNTIKGKI